MGAPPVRPDRPARVRAARGLLLQQAGAHRRPAVTGIGGVDNGKAWQLGRQEAANLVLRGEKEFFTRAPDGSEVRVVAVQGGFVDGRPWHFLQTQSDQFEQDNLKDLPNCGVAGLYQEQWY